MTNKSKDTRQQIIDAAHNEFLAQGFEGARMQSITDHIGVTKAMIHYYFNTKKELFEHVFRHSVQQVFGDLNEIYGRELPLFKKIEQLIEHCLQKADNNARELAFIITEMNRKPDWLEPIFEKEIQMDVTLFKEELDKAANNYEVASVSVHDLLMNIFSLCYYPSLAGPLHNALLKSPQKSYQEQSISQNRKGIILDTILNWLTA